MRDRAPRFIQSDASDILAEKTLVDMPDILCEIRVLILKHPIRDIIRIENYHIFYFPTGRT